MVKIAFYVVNERETKGFTDGERERDPQNSLYAYTEQCICIMWQTVCMHVCKLKY